MMSMEEWRKSPQSARNNPKLSPEKAQQIADEAIAGGQKWDVQEKINARRQAERSIECGGGLGKVLAPAKFDALVPLPRCQAGEGAFGTYFVHPSEKYGIKLFRNGDEDDVASEFRRLDKADYAGVNVPAPLRMSAIKDSDGDVRVQTLVMSHMKGYTQLSDTYPHAGYNAGNAPLIVQRKIVQEFRKLHTAGLAHGDIHGGNIMVNDRSRKAALVDFGYATELHDGRHPSHSRNGVMNLMYDMERLPDFLGFSDRGNDFIKRYKGVIENVEKQAKELAKYGGPDNTQRFTIAVKRYHDALETELLWDDRRPRSRFVSGADQPRIPGLTRRLLTAKFPDTFQREVIENLPMVNIGVFEKAAQGLGVKPDRLFLALKPERDARQAKQRLKPMGTNLFPRGTPRRPVPVRARATEWED